MIDIHCHILPEIDDGSKNIEDSLQMARNAVKQGISTIVATPHRDRRYHTTKDLINERVAQFIERLKEENISLNIVSGQEIALNSGICDDLNSGVLQTLGESRYVLVELPHDRVPSYSEQLLYKLHVNGYIPIIAHPERNAQLVKQPDLLYEFVSKGTLTQLTAASLVGVFGKKIMQFSEQLIEFNLVHFIASDSHSLPNRDFYLSEAFECLEEVFGKEYTEMYKGNAELLIKNQLIPTLSPDPIRRKKIFGVF